jgi:sterol desaturase/sphingolipid hydroxylase (fatty acid hydroxylase superfamily)
MNKPMTLAYSLLSAVAGTALAMAATYGCVRLLEMVAPRTTIAPASQLRSLRFWPYYLVVLSILGFTGGALSAFLPSEPLLLIGGERLYVATGLGPINYVVWPVISLIILDFFHYWKYRVQHQFFWRFHAIHHSIRDLSVVNSYHHWTDTVFSMILVSIPMAILIQFDAPTIFAIAALIGAQGAFIHSNTKIHLGLLNRLLVDNRFHRIHHSVEDHHFNKNFGERSTLWDQIFGTAYFPGKHEWPATGIIGEPEPVQTRDYFFRPFKRGDRHSATISRGMEESQSARGPAELGSSASIAGGGRETGPL